MLKLNLKNKFFIFSLIFLVFICISAVSAAENTTNDNVIAEYDDYLDYDFLDEDYNDEPQKAVITASDYSSYYDSGKLLPVKVKDSNGNPLRGVNVKIKFYDGSMSYDSTDSNGKAYLFISQNVGTHKATISIDDDNYKASAIKINVKITKAPVKMTAVKATSTTNTYATLKVNVWEIDGYDVDEGQVKFSVNGKTYSAKVYDGVAVKKVKLTSAKTYTYKATFTSPNYKSKTVSSKVVVKKAPKLHYYKKGGFSFKVSDSQYKKIQYVKNHKHSSYLTTYADFKVRADQNYYGSPVYAVVTTWSGIQNGRNLNYPQVQFVVMYGPDTWDWDYLTGHYKI